MVTASSNSHAATDTTPPTMTRLGDLLTEWEQEATAAYDALQTGRPRGPMTGFSTLDRELGNVLSPGLHVLHGSPGTGKTAFGLQVAATCGFPALIVSCEMGRLELFRRITARLTGTYLGRLKSGELEPATSLDLARRAAVAAPDLALADATRAFASPDWIQAAAEHTRGHAEHVLIVIDSVHSWAESEQGNLTEYDGLNAALVALRSIAGYLQCPVLAIAERNRASMKDGGLNASASSRKFEYGAETVFDLNRPKDTPPDAAGEVPIDLTIQKNRNGAHGKKISLKFQGALQRYRED